MTVPSLRGSTRHEYSVSVARLGMALSPANSAIPSSRISGMTWPLRPMPQSLSARSALRAQSAGIIPDPGRLAVTSSRSMRARSDANRNRPPKAVLSCRGARSNAFLSAAGACATAGIWSGRRRGSLGRPASLRSFWMVPTLSGPPSSASRSRMSWIDRPCRRRSSTRCRRSARPSPDPASGGFAPAGAGNRKSGSSALTNCEHRLRKDPWEYPKRRAASSVGHPSTKRARSAS